MEFRNPLIFSLLILAASTASSGTINRIGLPPNIHIDKAVHMTMYFVFTMSLIKYAAGENSKPPFHLKIISATAAIIFGILMEYIQMSCTTNRHFELLDIAANIAGTAIAALLYTVLGKTFVYRLF